MDIGKSIASWRRSRALPVALICLAFVVLHGRGLDYEYVWDDTAALTTNPIFRGPWADGLTATQHDHLSKEVRQLQGLRPAHDSFRPLLYLSLRADVELFGMHPRPMRIHSLILALLSILLVFAIARRWLGDDRHAFVATALFALHPLVVEPVAYVSGRGDVLAGFLALVAIWLALRFSDRSDDGASLSAALWLAAMAVSFVASLAAKEAYIGVPLAVMAIGWSRGALRSTWLPAAVLALAFAAYLLVRLTLARATGPGTAFESALILPGLWLQYLKVVVFPLSLSAERPFQPGYVVPGWIAVTAATTIAVLIAKRSRSTRGDDLRVVLSGLGCAFVLIGPSAIVVHLMGVAADRYMYLPLVGVCIALVAGGRAVIRALRLPRWRVWAGLVAGAWGLIVLAITFLQVPVWQNERTLFEHAVAMEPDSSMAHYRLGVTYASRGECLLALPLFERAIELDGENNEALNNLGVCSMQLGRLDQARTLFERVIEQTKGAHYRSWYNLGVVYLARGDRRRACKAVSEALWWSPGYEKARRLYDRECREP